MLEDIIKEEQKIQNLVNNIIFEICNEISNTPDPDVTRITPNMSIVTLDHVARYNNLSAQFYSAEAQSKLVEQALKNTKTATDLIKKVNKLLNEKKYDVYALHPHTIAILEKYTVIN